MSDVDLSQGLRVNFTDEEASSKDLEPLPVGKYNCVITDGEVRFSKLKDSNGAAIPDSEDQNKPYYALEFTVQDGKYEGRKTWSNIMLFAGALYSLGNLMNALGQAPEAGEVTAPAINDLIGTPIGVRLAMGKDSKEKNEDGSPKYPARVEVKGYFSTTETKASQAASKLP